MSDCLESLKQERFLPGPMIVNLYRIEGTLTTRSPLHIGSGVTEEVQNRNSESLPKLLIIRDHANRPVIPGSSLRGAIRSWIESMLLPFNTPGQYDVASLSGGEFDFQQGLTQAEIEKARQDAREQVGKGSGLGESEQHIQVERKMTEYYLSHLDLVAGLFGHGRFHSRVDFENATWGESGDVETHLFDMPGVSINPVTGAAKKGHLFSVKAVKPGKKFRAVITLRNVARWELGLLLVAMDAFNDEAFPLRIGGHEGTDFGRMSWELTSIRMFGDANGAMNPASALSQWAVWCGVETAETPTDQTQEIGKDAKEKLEEQIRKLAKRREKIAGAGTADPGGSPSGGQDSEEG